MKPLSPTMQQAIAVARENGDRLVRYPGGFWWKQNAKFSEYRYCAFGTTTIQALVARGMAEYTIWQHTGRGPDFPVEITLLELSA